MQFSLKLHSHSQTSGQMIHLLLLGLFASPSAANTVPVTMGNHWSGGFQGDFCLPFTLDVTSWKARIHFSMPTKSLEIYLADIESQNTDGTEYVVVNKPFNGDEHPGDKLCLSFQGHADGDITPTATVVLENMPDPTTPPSTTSTTTTPTTTRTLGPGETWPPTTTHPPTTKGTKPLHVPHNQTLTMELIQNRNGQWEGQFCVDLKEEIQAWELLMTFSVGVKSIQNYEGDIVGSSSGCSKHWTMVNRKAKGVHYAGDHYCVRMTGNVCSGSGDPSGTAVLVDVTNDGQTLPLTPVVTGAQATKYNYAEILMKSILFYEAQRSGKLPPDNRIPWRADSALNDKGANGEDLTGGWYDAGDNVKFNFPMAFSTTLLTWSLLEYIDAYNASGQLEKMYECIRWPLDYFIKCHTKPNELYAQVGDGGADHGTWTSPERMTGRRPAFKIDASGPGSDLAMETAAAMAAGSMVFKDKDPDYSRTLLKHAKELFEFGKAHQGKYSSTVSNAAAFYASQDYEDENSWGGVWLYKATGDQTYLDYAEQHFVNKTAWGFSWDEKIGGANLLLYNLTKKDRYKKVVEGTFVDWFPGGSIDYSPKCLAFRLQWGSLRYAANTAFLALAAADAGLNTDSYRKWAMTQLHYAFGDTGRSFIVGYGVNPPQRPHHRASSCPMLPAPCEWESQTQKGPNPHTLYGAMVGGPGRDDSYKDDRKDYVKNEVACDYNAGMHASTAALEHLAIAHALPTTYKDVCP
ncbi:endoglucanase 4-like isoform X1 [Haliotis rubra]|uniref:endoglucanase 4-like isoform X1 n=1 Tax=Haliotis rubra TaxID=36100 RepID=UPI001EE60FB7|nr:endoglucanase 4-like isoform X1 [Haliotis rubra]